MTKHAAMIYHGLWPVWEMVPEFLYPGENDQIFV